MPPAPPAWPRRDGGGAASAPTSRSPSGPPSRVGARPPRARVRPPSRPPLCGWTTGRHRAEAPRAARPTAPEARGAARAARLHCAGADRPAPQDLSRCSGPVAARSSVARSSSPPRPPRSCDPAPKARSPESAAPLLDRAPTGTPLPDPPRSDEQQPAPWFASATHGPPAYPLRNSPGIRNSSPSPGNRIKHLLQPDRAETLTGYGAVKTALEAPFGPLSLQAFASQIYGLYTGLVYLTPVFGGLLADRILGPRRTVILGAVLMAAGHFMMAFERWFFAALLLLILGNGAFKPNISTQVGGLYAPGDPRRDRAYSI